MLKIWPTLVSLSWFDWIYKTSVGLKLNLSFGWGQFRFSTWGKNVGCYKTTKLFQTWIVLHADCIRTVVVCGRTVLALIWCKVLSSDDWSFDANARPRKLQKYSFEIFSSLDNFKYHVIRLMHLGTILTVLTQSLSVWSHLWLTPAFLNRCAISFL